ncbi:MAG: EF-hand domain-containing protein [Pseudoxanthomonas sp.]
MTDNRRMHRQSFALLIALGVAAAAPMAFAQDATTAAPTQDAPQAQDPSQPAATQTSQAASSTPKQGWEDVDTDKDGAIDKQESAANPGLAQVFDQADADADGKLTVEEYKSFVAKNYNTQPQPAQ